MSPLILFPDETITVAPAYCGSVVHYARMAAFGNIVIDTNRIFDKHDHTARRCEIVGTSGRIKLSVPTKKTDYRNSAIANLEVDFIVDWRRNHWGALYSAYGRSPFFDYYADLFHDIYTRRFTRLIDYDIALDNLIRPILGIESPVTIMKEDEEPHLSHEKMVDVNDVEYYQVWSEKHGFQSRLSALDLIFNLGTESPLLLRKMLKRC